MSSSSTLKKIMNSPMGPEDGGYYTVISFLKSAKVNTPPSGEFGIFKVSGSYRTDEEAEKRSQYLVKNVDPDGIYLTVKNGEWAPLVERTNDIGGNKAEYKTSVYMGPEEKEEVAKIFDERVQERKAEEAKSVREMKERELELIHDVTREITSFDDYKTNRAKFIQLCTHHRALKDKIKELVESLKDVQFNKILKTYETSKSLEEHENFEQKYIDYCRECHNNSMAHWKMMHPNREIPSIEDNPSEIVRLMPVPMDELLQKFEINVKQLKEVEKDGNL